MNPCRNRPPKEEPYVRFDGMNELAYSNLPQSISCLICGAMHWFKLPMSEATFAAEAAAFLRAHHDCRLQAEGPVSR